MYEWKPKNKEWGRPENAAITITHHLLMLVETIAIVTDSSVLVIGIVRAEDMEPGRRVDVTIHMITHGLVINPSFNLYDI